MTNQELIHRAMAITLKLHDLRLQERRLRSMKKNYTLLGREENPLWDELKEISLALTGEALSFNLSQEWMKLVDPEYLLDPLGE